MHPRDSYGHTNSKAALPVNRNIQIKKHQESFLFLKRAIKNPRNMGAIIPSSQNLGEYACKYIPKNPDHLVVEIGAGTGSLTKSLLNAGISKDRLIAVELDTELSKLLTVKFHDLHVIHGNASELSKILPPSWIGKIGTIVSGIPMVNLSKDTQRSIIESCLEVLSPHGQILQFTYGFVSPLPAKTLNLSSKRLGHVLMNVPPASWWRFSKRVSSYHLNHDAKGLTKVRSTLKKVLALDSL
jgi:phosphatidylethanolamine/phosphatidyl-N-methylethanolamine N-methyltransferase